MRSVRLFRPRMQTPVRTQGELRVVEEGIT